MTSDSIKWVLSLAEAQEQLPTHRDVCSGGEVVMEEEESDGGCAKSVEARKDDGERVVVGAGSRQLESTQITITWFASRDTSRCH